MDNIRISRFQLATLIMSFLFGEVAISVPGNEARQDIWLSFIIAWVGGFVLLGLYVAITRLNPEKTLIEILKKTFGRYLGSIIAVLYIWYFIHLGALVLRYFSEFLKLVLYPETPLIFLGVSVMLVVAYVVRNGLEVIARASELLIPLLLLIIIFTIVFMLPIYEFKNFLPFLEQGIKPVLTSSLELFTYPFGETVLFLMVFPYLNIKKDCLKISYISLFIMGLFILNIFIRDLLVLGPDMFTKTVFPPSISTRLIPNDINFDPLIGINILIGGGVKITICLYATAMGITQVFNLKDYKPFVLPISAIIVSLSIWK